MGESRINGNQTVTGDVIINGSLLTADNSTADANPTEDVTIKTGDKTAGTGDSGDFVVDIGTSAGGVRGKMVYKDGTEGASKIMTSDATGRASWATPAAGGADTDLGNLTSPVAFNQNLIPDGDKTRDMGQPTKKLDEIHGQKMVLTDRTDQAGLTFFGEAVVGMSLPSGGAVSDLSATSPGV